MLCARVILAYAAENWSSAGNEGEGERTIKYVTFGVSDDLRFA